MAFYDPYTAMIGNGHMMGGMLGAYPGMAGMGWPGFGNGMMGAYGAPRYPAGGLLNDYMNLAYTGLNPYGWGGGLYAGGLGMYPGMYGTGMGMLGGYGGLGMMGMMGMMPGMGMIPGSKHFTAGSSL
ncbi:hypothetical protein NliqN6_2624 [Naganishia liquefaciens]|uniref:Uncharacterized protein n=1 Tax=Naganishia liquefaciens TaxID=104408 RepID=A0A8H3TS60_9TREE|nr:hypothetical protein NliqN6_2624 [Naganishia liquefaciens]